MSEFEKQILDFFDKCPTRDQIRSLSLMYAVPEATIIGLLERSGREIPAKKRGPKPKISKECEKELRTSIEEPVLQIPTCVMETIEKRMHELETDIKNHQDMVRILEAEYKAHANFLLQSPFEQRNLSHSCSDDKVESPQAMA